MAGPKYFKGVKPTKVSPESVNAPLVIDISGIMNAVMLMQGAAGLANDGAFTKAFSENAIGAMESSFHKEVAKYAKTDGRKSTKHLFKWDEVEDQVNKFKVTKLKVTPTNRLYFMPPAKNNSIKIGFFLNDKPALMDPRVKSLARRPDTISEHHFKDQAEELESVSFIQKDSRNVSSRRTGGASGHARWSDKGRLKQKRIVGINENGDRLSYYKIVNRPNPFFGNFKKVFYEFYTTKASINMISAFNRSVKQKGMPKTSRIMRQRMKASDRTISYGTAGVGKGIRPTIILTDKTFRLGLESANREVLHNIVSDLDSHVSSAYDSRTLASITSMGRGGWRL